MKMKSIGKAGEIVSKAAAALRGKAGVLRARLLFLTSLRCRAALVAGISRHIRALTSTSSSGQPTKKAAATRRRHAKNVVHNNGDTDDDVLRRMRMAAELASSFEGLDEQHGDGGGSSREDCWTLALHALFDDEEEEESDVLEGGDLSLEEGLEEEDEQPSSVIDLIRSRREDEGREFRIDDEIDQAADMYIMRVHHRRRMGAQRAAP